VSIRAKSGNPSRLCLVNQQGLPTLVDLPNTNAIPGYRQVLPVRTEYGPSFFWLLHRDIADFDVTGNSTHTGRPVQINTNESLQVGVKIDRRRRRAVAILHLLCDSQIG